MYSKSKKFIILILVAFCVFALCGCKSKGLDIVFEDSYTSDYEVAGDKVHINCKIVISNSNEEAKRITIKGYSERDFTSGLLKNPYIFGYDKDLNSDVFEVLPGENVLEVTFLGDFGGSNQKSDMELPLVTISVVK
jgi:hypothetical protein